MAETTDLQARARALAELLRPHPHRGDLIGAGAVPLTVALLLVNVRLDASWGTGIFLVLTGLACALVLAMGVLAPLEREQPRSYQVVLQLCGLVLLFVALLRLAQVLGVDEPLDSAGASFWMLAVVACAAAWLARERRSAICALVAAVAGTFALLSFVSWVFSPDGPATSRWVLLFVALGLLVGALLLRDRHRTESVYLIDAAGFAVLAIGLTYVGSLLFGFAVFERSDGLVRGFDGPGAWWKLVIVAGGLGLVAYAGVDRQPGPGWLGVLNLLVFVVLVGQPGEGGASLWFWPMILLLVGGAMIAAGLRPREPLPPEPGRADPAPVVPVTPASPPSPPPSASPPAADPPDESPPAAASGPEHASGAASGPEHASGAASGPEHASGAASGPEQAPGAASGPEHASGAASGPEQAPGAASAPDRPGAASPPGSAPAWDRPPAPAPGPEQPPNGAAAPDRSPEPPAASPPPPPPPPAEPAARPEPEPPARGSLWARADPGEQPTKPHRRPPSAGDDDA